MADPTPEATAWWRHWTVRGLSALFLVGCLWDCLAFTFGGNEATITRVITENSRRYLIIPFVIGGLAAHLYASQTPTQGVRTMASLPPDLIAVPMPDPTPKTFLEKLLAIGIAARTKGGAWKLVPSDFTKAGVTLGTVLAVAYSALSALATYAPQIGEAVKSLGFPKAGALALAIGGASVKLIALWAQGHAVTLDPGDPTRPAPSSNPVSP